MRNWMWMTMALAACEPTADEPALDLCDWGPSHTWEAEDVPRAIAQAFEAELGETRADGVAYAILVDGEIRYAGAAGSANDSGTPMSPTTLLRSGSTLKMQTSAALLALEADGLLSRDDTLGDWVPDFSVRTAPGMAEGITVHQLLSHQGGFFDYTPINGPAGRRSLREHALDVFSAYPMLTEPGNFYNYSNPNFSLAGLVAEEASGAFYADVMRDELWAPLCMNRTFLDGDEVAADGDFATAVTVNWETGQGAVDVGPDTYDHGFAKPAGFAWTSVLDMLHFAHFLLEGHDDVMPMALSSEITARQVDTLDGVGNFYGYGVVVNDGFSLDAYRASELWSHGGAIPGYAADLYVHPDSGVAIAVLANGDGAYFTRSIATALDALASPPVGDAAPDPAPTDLSVYAGAYVDTDNIGRVTFEVDGDDLRLVSAPTLDGAGLTYSDQLQWLSRDSFVWEIDGSPLVVTFIADDTGTYRWMRHRAFVAERAEVMAVAPITGDAASIRRALRRPGL